MRTPRTPRTTVRRVAVVDIGSNSVRLVVYEGLSRSPTALFNEKALCGLGREVQTTGLLAADAVEQALSSLKRYRALCTTMGVQNGPGDRYRRLPRRQERPRLHQACRADLQTEIEVLSGQREAELTALGVISARASGGRSGRRPWRWVA